MKTEEQKLIIELLAKAIDYHPTWRVGQIIANALRTTGHGMDLDPFHIQDEEIIRGLKNLLK